MPAGAVSGVSWILCAFAFLFSVLKDSWAAPLGDRRRFIRGFLIPSVFRPLAAVCNHAKKALLVQRLHQSPRIWAFQSISFAALPFLASLRRLVEPHCKASQNHSSALVRARPSSKRRWPPTAPPISR